MASKKAAYPWAFRARFRANAFGWKSHPAITRVREAVVEIKKVAKSDPIVAADGAVLFLERVSPALAHVDSSSGAIGSAVNRAIEELVAVIAAAPADAKAREGWLERLYEACAADEIPYIETLGDLWGEVCVTKEIASRWADRELGITRHALSPDPKMRGHYHGAVACLASLSVAARSRIRPSSSLPCPTPSTPPRNPASGLRFSPCPTEVRLGSNSFCHFSWCGGQ